MARSLNKSPTNQVILLRRPEEARPLCGDQTFSPGAFSRPHFHPNDRFITVLKGTWWVGTGPKFDANDTCRCHGHVRDALRQGLHWDGAKDEEAMLLITGMGPAHQHAGEAD